MGRIYQQITPVFTLLLLVFLNGCQEKKEADVIIHNAQWLSPNEVAGPCALAVVNDRLVAQGPENQIFNEYHSNNTVNINRRFVLKGVHRSFPWNDSVAIKPISLPDSIATFTILNTNPYKNSPFDHSVFPIEIYEKGKRIYNYYDLPNGK